MNPIAILAKLAVFSKTQKIGSTFCDLDSWLDSFEIPQPDEFKYYFNIRISSLDDVSNYFGKTLKVGGSVHKYDIIPRIQKSLTDVNIFDKKKIVILIPTYHRLQKTKNGIESIISSLGVPPIQRESKNEVYINKNGDRGWEYTPNEFRIFIGDNGTKTEEMKNLLLEFEKDERVTIYFSPTNLGKATMVNRLYELMKETGFLPDYIFSCDSDMLYDHPKYKYSQSRFDHMIQVLECCNNIGIVSSQQLGECHHWFGRGVVEKNEHGFKIAESKTGIGVAGGCVCLRAKDWEKIGGYREDYDIYTADDAILMEKIEKGLGKRAVIAMEAPFFHPPPMKNEEDYVKWKKERFLQDGLRFRETGHKGIDKGFFD